MNRVFYIWNLHFFVAVKIFYEREPHCRSENCLYWWLQQRRQRNHFDCFGLYEITCVCLQDTPPFCLHSALLVSYKFEIWYIWRAYWPLDYIFHIINITRLFEGAISHIHGFENNCTGSNSKLFSSQWSKKKPGGMNIIWPQLINMIFCLSKCK